MGGKLVPSQSESRRTTKTQEPTKRKEIQEIKDTRIDTHTYEHNACTHDANHDASAGSWFKDVNPPPDSLTPRLPLSQRDDWTMHHFIFFVKKKINIQGIFIYYYYFF